LDSHVETHWLACPLVFVKQNAIYGGLVEITMAHFSLACVWPWFFKHFETLKTKFRLNTHISKNQKKSLRSVFSEKKHLEAEAAILFLFLDFLLSM